MRRRVRDAPLQQAADRDRPAAALRDGSFLCHGRGRLPPRRQRRDRARGAASAAGRPRWPARRNCAGTAIAVTIFDNRPLPGGLNTYGVAEYKLRPADSLREVELVRSHGRGVPLRRKSATRSLARRTGARVRRHLHRRRPGRHGAARHPRRGAPRRDRRARASSHATRRCRDFRVGRTRGRDRRRQYRHRRRQRRAAAGRGRRLPPLPPRRNARCRRSRSSTITAKVEGVQFHWHGAAGRDRRTRRARRRRRVRRIRAGRAGCERPPYRWSRSRDRSSTSPATW